MLRLSAICLSLLLFATSAAKAAAQDSEEAPSLLASFQDILDLLNHDSVLHQSDVKNSIVKIPTKRNDLKGVMLIRWQAKDGVVQFIQSMPMNVPDDRVSAVETAVVRLNHALAVPGFGLDHKNKATYFRLVVPFQPRGGMEDKEFRTYFQVTLKQATEFYPYMKKVAEEGADPLTIVDDVRREAQRRKEAASFPTT